MRALWRGHRLLAAGRDAAGFCGIVPATPGDTARQQIAARAGEALANAGRAEDAPFVTRNLAYTLGIEPVERQSQGLAADRATVQDGITRAWRLFFDALAASAPLIVMIDDIHWADDALLDLIEAIASRSSGAILFLCTARPELLQRRPTWSSGKSDGISVSLEPLLPEESRRLIAALLDSSLPPALRDGILQRGEGNPFFIEELTRMLIDRGVISERDGQWSAAEAWPDALEDIPDTVQGVLAARIDLLQPIERDVLRHAAIIGRTFWPSALIGIAGHLTWEQLDDALHSLIAKDLLAPAHDDAQMALSGEPRYLFRHPLTRDVVYDAMPRARRAHEHEHFAEWLEHVAAEHVEEYAELLAQHYEAYYRQANLARARDAARRRVIRDKVTHYLEIAGDEALIRQATNAAIRSFSRAIALLLEDGEAARAEHREALIRLYAHRGDARAARSDGDGAYADYQAALRLWQEVSPAPDCNPADERTTGMRLYRRLVTLLRALCQLVPASATTRRVARLFAGRAGADRRRAHQSGSRSRAPA